MTEPHRHTNNKNTGFVVQGLSGLITVARSMPCLAVLEYKAVICMCFISLYCKLFAKNALHYCFCLFILSVMQVSVHVYCRMWLAESYFFEWRLKHNKEKRILMQKQKMQERWLWCCLPYLLFDNSVYRNTSFWKHPLAEWLIFITKIL